MAEDQLEIEKTLSLRYNVFNLEMGEGLPESASTRKDRDEYDYFCDHLIVLDKKQEDKIVGTYRILRKDVALENIGFYSETEFDLSKIYAMDENVAEVGRSCVHPDYRNGSVITLLWAGLAEYMQVKNLRYLMGCGSIHSTDPKSASEAYAYLRANNALAGEEFAVTPLSTHKLHGFEKNYVVDNIKEITKTIPPLIKGYVRLGAKICGEPAIDRIFNTTDVFVLFDYDNISEKYGKKFGKETA
ncbi:MAG: GNAT family N-acyltransferase [Leptospiraceae bacterium]|nr:GNAT family N-acyltransferase [Leptospiraceae bacterium]